MFQSTRIFLITILAAAPIFAGSVPGIKNFDRVNDHLYRGGQPTERGFRYLAAIGVKTVIDLQEADSRGRTEQEMVTRTGMSYINVPMTGLTPPSEAEITRILAVLEDSSKGAVFVHCHRGADRTGAVIAAYHINHDKWDNQHALQDAEAHRMSFFQLPRKAFIRSFHAREIESARDNRISSVTGLAATVVPAEN